MHASVHASKGASLSHSRVETLTSLPTAFSAKFVSLTPALTIRITSLWPLSIFLHRICSQRSPFAGRVHVQAARTRAHLSNSIKRFNAQVMSKCRSSMHRTSTCRVPGIIVRKHQLGTCTANSPIRCLAPSLHSHRQLGSLLRQPNHQ